jgi:hypothetical protein
MPTGSSPPLHQGAVWLPVQSVFSEISPNIAMKLNPELISILSPAYEPCEGFKLGCGEMRWNPAIGHVPRGFTGASASVSDVELVLVFAEPGDPQPGESHTGLLSSYEFAYSAFATGMTLFHRNVRYILDSCWPRVSFDEQMQRTWLTESVLCSAVKEGGNVRAATVRECGQRYLAPQLAVIPNAIVAALGGKAASRLRMAGVKGFLEAGAPSTEPNHSRSSASRRPLPCMPSRIARPSSIEVILPSWIMKSSSK